MHNSRWIIATGATMVALVVACGDTKSSGSSENLALTVSGKCDDWARKIGQQLCASSQVEEIEGARGTKTICEQAVGTAIFKHTKRVKANLCHIADGLLDRRADCGIASSELTAENAFTNLCKNERAVDCLAWQDSLVQKLSDAGISCQNIGEGKQLGGNINEGKQLHKHCTDAIGLFLPFSSGETDRNNVCNIFAAATKTGEPFTSNPAVSVRSLSAVCRDGMSLKQAVFNSFTETCLSKDGFRANLDPTLSQLLKQSIR
ncbi:MAG: hypothetical protein AAF310_00610 [Myxococcota bacterium]